MERAETVLERVVPTSCVAVNGAWRAVLLKGRFSWGNKQELQKNSLSWLYNTSVDVSKMLAENVNSWSHFYGLISRILVGSVERAIISLQGQKLICNSRLRLCICLTVSWKEGKSCSAEYLTETSNRNVQGATWPHSTSDVTTQEPYLFLWWDFGLRH